MVALRVAICAMRTLPFFSSVGSVSWLSSVSIMRIIVSTLAMSSERPSSSMRVERFEHAPAPDRRRDAAPFSMQMIAARRGGDLEALFDEGEVLVEIAVELGGEAVVFEGQFKLQRKGRCRGWRTNACSSA